ncbi:uncharacterized protein LOC117916679 isoform X1 [Vitis riparia]|uniref:uncharacterized protein LOC117916679 isoform X1 n=1 Tax=Vitis riparia TaxID=96939 RepID=UPI00155A3B26|nr:uncharacterized protein LOC117916679 isoform X1 [Vitis riparia]XP_034688718.1 uncharacterized protein LOC117916679 isoform X1 [Vitis riparia]XP_034688719.1 uncharacterized protein LOC117916679 isoform X1 [Vitis riparia]
MATTEEILEKYYVAECAINSYQKGIQQQLGIMHGLIHRLDARRERNVHSPTTGHSGYAADDFPEAEHDSPYAPYDMPFHHTEEVPDTPIRHPPIIGARMKELTVVSDFVCVAKLGHIYFVLVYVYSE